MDISKVGSLRGLLYLRHNASWNSPLFRLNPCSLRGKAPSQLEAPVSVSCSRFLFVSLDIFVWMVFNFSSAIALRMVMASVLAFLTSLLSGNSLDWVMIFSFRGNVIFLEAR